MLGLDLLGSLKNLRAKKRHSKLLPAAFVGIAAQGFNRVHHYR